MEEALVTTPEGTNLKPDLVVINEGQVNVLDVTVRHEENEYLQEGYNSKVEKYEPLLHTLASQLSTQPGRVYPIVVGSRGAIPKETIQALQDLKIGDRNTYVTISLMALRSSIEIYHTFMDYDGPRRIL
jgi:hypothetical protein